MKRSTAFLTAVVLLGAICLAGCHSDDAPSDKAVAQYEQYRAGRSAGTPPPQAKGTDAGAPAKQ